MSDWECEWRWDSRVSRQATGRSFSERVLEASTISAISVSLLLVSFWCSHSLTHKRLITELLPYCFCLLWNRRSTAEIEVVASACCAFIQSLFLSRYFHSPTHSPTSVLLHLLTVSWELSKVLNNRKRLSISPIGVVSSWIVSFSYPTPSFPLSHLLSHLCSSHPRNWMSSQASCCFKISKVHEMTALKICALRE